MAQMVKHLPSMWETQVQSLGWEDPLEKEMATHSSTLAWKIPWTEEPGSLQSMGSQRVRQDWVTKLNFNWKIIAFQYCVGSCYTTTCISHEYPCGPSLLNFPPHPTPPGCHRAHSWAPCTHTAASHWLSISHGQEYLIGGVCTSSSWENTGS